ncbi:hypothetical protein P879_11697 [Paragonimus westermani]|uniref:RRM domain-containing protein n=1 Tax=Paragonimus westermani TaxID=34504 RepID=A0A8T0CYU3_9TREM|nr:hypothetical protein P879_11697 [Paragonimus westermani]
MESVNHSLRIYRSPVLFFNLSDAGINFETSEREFHFPDNDLNAVGCWSSVFCARASGNQDTTSQNEAQLSGMEVDSELGIDNITCNQTTLLGEVDTNAIGEGVSLRQPDILLSPSPPTTPGYLPITHCRSVAKLVAHMHAKGAQWNKVHLIAEQYQPAIVRKTETVDDNLVVRARGLPWQATDMDIARFFSGLNIAPGGISLVLSDIGRRNGEALVQFTQPEQRDLALRKHKHHMGQRYIEVYAASGRDFVTFAGVETTEAEEFLKRFTSLDQALIRMRGLPYTATEADILQFFANANCPVQYGEAGVLFVNRRSGQATGDAFVMFETQALAAEALKSHRQHIGNRYIELFKSTPAEVNQVSGCIPILSVRFIEYLPELISLTLMLRCSDEDEVCKYGYEDNVKKKTHELQYRLSPNFHLRPYPAIHQGVTT